MRLAGAWFYRFPSTIAKFVLLRLKVILERNGSTLLFRCHAGRTTLESPPRDRLTRVREERHVEVTEAVLGCEVDGARTPAEPLVAAWPICHLQMLLRAGFLGFGPSGARSKFESLAIQNGDTSVRPNNIPMTAGFWESQNLFGRLDFHWFPKRSYKCGFGAFGIVPSIVLPWNN